MFKGKWNSLIWINGKPFRHRVETFIFNDSYSELYICKRPNGSYKIPGGHLERKVSKAQQALNECKEEARIIVKNLKYIGNYTELYNANYNNLPIPVCGQFVEVYVGKYGKAYSGPIFSQVRDHEMEMYGEFHPFDEVYPILKSQHRQIVDLLL